MYISSLQLEHIRSYTSLDVSFSQGINVLFGNIGSGKSSILLSIEVALFGLKKGEGSYLLRKGEKSGSITLTLNNALNNALDNPSTNSSNDTNSIEIHRTFKKTSQGVSQESGYVKINSQIQELSTQEQNMFIFKFFNFPLSFVSKDKTLLYRFTHYTPQEQLKTILTTSSDKRLEILRKVFNIDNYKQLQHALQLTQKEIAKEILVTQTQINELPKELDVEQEKCLKHIKHSKEEYEQLKIQKEHILKKIDVISKNKETLLKKEEHISQESKRAKLLKNEIEEYNTKERDIMSVIKELEKNISEYERQHTTFNIQLKELEHHLTNYTKNKEKLDTLKHSIERINEEIIVYEKEQSLYEQYTIYNNEITELNNELTKLHCVCKDLEIELERNSKKISKYATELTQKEKLQKQIKEIEKTIIELEATLKGDIKQIENFKSLDSHSSTICSLCGQEITTEHIQKEIEFLNLKIEKSKQNLQELDSSLLREEIKQLEEKEKEHIKLEQINDQKNESLISTKDAIEQLNKKISSKKDAQKLLQYSTTHSDIKQKLKDIHLKKEEYKNEEKNLEKELEKGNNAQKNNEEIQKKIQHLNETQIKENIKLEQHKKELKTIQVTIKKCSTEFKEIENTSLLQDKIKIKLNEQSEIEKKVISKKEILISKITATTHQIQQYEKELKHIEKNITKYIALQEKNTINTSHKHFLQNEMTTLCKVLEEAVLKEIHNDINQILHQYFNELIELDDLEVYLREDFSISIEQNGFEVEVEQLSGGEKSALALSYRLALKEVIEKHFFNSKSLQYIMLDEPTDGFSQSQIQKFASILKTSKFAQVFLVSHDENLLSSAQHTFIIEKENHVSTISNIQ